MTGTKIPRLSVPVKTTWDALDWLTEKSLTDVHSMVLLAKIGTHLKEYNLAINLLNATYMEEMYPNHPTPWMLDPVKPTKSKVFGRNYNLGSKDEPTVDLPWDA